MSKKNIIIYILFLIIMRVCAFLFIPSIQIHLIGDELVILKYEQEYVEKGAKVYNCNIFKCSLLTSNIQISEFDTSNIGEYDVVYTYNNFCTKVRKVKVIDTEKPTITINGNNIIYLPINASYNELGAKANDNYDGDITEKIIINGNVDTNKAGSYSIIYSVKDSSNNESKITRKIVIYGNEEKNIKDIDDKEIKEAITKIEDYIKNNHLSISVLYNDIINGYTFTYNPNIVYYGCSLIKTLDAMYVYENMDVTEKLRSNVKKAIEVSDNNAHYYLVNTIGKNKLIEYGKKIGAKNVLTISDIYGNTTVHDQKVFMRHLFYLLNTLPNANELKNFFLSDFKKYMNFDGAPQIVHKFGRISGKFFHESAVILDKSPYVLTILTKEDDKKYIITELSKMIYNLHLLLNEKEV